MTSSVTIVLGCLVRCFCLLGGSSGGVFVGLVGIFPVVVLGWVLILQKATGKTVQNEGVQEMYLWIFKHCLKRSKFEVLKEKFAVRTTLKLSNLTTFFHSMHNSAR